MFSSDRITLNLMFAAALASMNAEIPADPIPSNRYDVFAAVLALSVIIMTVYGFVVRHWWTQAKRRRIKML